MKRDKDPVRLLLLAIEKEPAHDCRASIGIRTSSFEGYDAPTVSYHFQMLVSGGFAVGEVRHGPSITCEGLNWSGHELLDAVRDAETWTQTKEVAQRVGNWSFDILKGIATACIKSKIKEKTGLELS